ncbi:hypothetical protein QA584_17425 [Anaerocolumna sp. AGMB13025]|uniref:hypothetical protein n=1 Tax=Anaerocolumna sp. AGMB13025 TaxID=3039116 RepID=UPI00242030B4|nr:hypothetical protein [Anaerocolumna sp. AGMB13025]WFR55382.1 hypothetical protein QA584_17425 [Anaerocolumna sp. AGMB13025]
MKERIGFVAIGQAGGNIGRLFEQKGFSVLYVNTSQEDLDTLADVKFMYHITGGEGCNKDRHKAKQLVVEDFDNIAQQIDLKLNTDIVFVIFASGGGTGSGAGPMLMDLLIDEKKTVGAITILPSRQESIKSQINSYECFTELIDIRRSAAVFVLDNDKGDKLTLNQELAEIFQQFIDIPDKHKSILGNIDKAEMEETMKAHGMAVITQSKEEGAAGLIKALNENSFAPIENDGIIKYIAISSCGDFHMTDITKVVGIPLDTFQTYNEDATVCMISGLSYPKTRLDGIYQTIKDSQDMIIKNLRATSELKLNSDVNFLNEFAEHGVKQQKDEKPKSKRDIMSKYFKG